MLSLSLCVSVCVWQYVCAAALKSSFKANAIEFWLRFALPFFLSKCLKWERGRERKRKGKRGGERERGHAAIKLLEKCCNEMLQNEIKIESIWVKAEKGRRKEARSNRFEFNYIDYLMTMHNAELIWILGIYLIIRKWLIYKKNDRYKYK